jgi:hypothetical protein
MTLDLITATHDTFEPFVSQKFTVITPDGPLDLLLDNVKIFHGSTVRDNKLVIDGVLYPPRQAFALTWEGPREPIVSSGTYQFEHPQIGVLSMFLSAFRQDHDCMLYESVFN